MTHLVNIGDLDNQFIARIFAAAEDYKRRRQISREMWNQLYGRLHNYLLITDFFEPSLRTRFSFEAAMCYLGGHVIGSENAAEFSSFKKGESLSDNFKVISGYGDIIVGRFKNEGEAQLAADSSAIPLINGGDGKGEHPTQALIDLFSITENFPDEKAHDLSITFIGDNLHSRTVQSLARLVARFPAITKMTFVGPEGQNYHIDDHTGFLHSLREITLDYGRPDGSLGFLCMGSLSDTIMSQTNIAYVTRSQIERHHPGSTMLNGNDEPDIVLSPELADLMPEHGLILHPLPRNLELPITVDGNPRAYYFTQAHNGLFIRMALLEELCTR